MNVAECDGGLAGHLSAHRATISDVRDGIYVLDRKAASGARPAASSDCRHPSMSPLKKLQMKAMFSFPFFVAVLASCSNPYEYEVCTRVSAMSACVMRC